MLLTIYESVHQVCCYVPNYTNLLVSKPRILFSRNLYLVGKDRYELNNHKNTYRNATGENIWMGKAHGITRISKRVLDLVVKVREDDEIKDK